MRNSDMCADGIAAKKKPLLTGWIVCVVSSIFLFFVRFFRPHKLNTFRLESTECHVVHLAIRKVVQLMASHAMQYFHMSQIANKCTNVQICSFGLKLQLHRVIYPSYFIAISLHCAISLFTSRWSLLFAVVISQKRKLSHEKIKWKCFTIVKLFVGFE